jgi:hypothetical protein
LPRLRGNLPKNLSQGRHHGHAYMHASMLIALADVAASRLPSVSAGCQSSFNNDAAWLLHAASPTSPRPFYPTITALLPPPLPRPPRPCDGRRTTYTCPASASRRSKPPFETVETTRGFSARAQRQSTPHTASAASCMEGGTGVSALALRKTSGTSERAAAATRVHQTSHRPKSRAAAGGVGRLAVEGHEERTLPPAATHVALLYGVHAVLVRLEHVLDGRYAHALCRAEDVWPHLHACRQACRHKNAIISRTGHHTCTTARGVLWMSGTWIFLLLAVI